MGSNKALLQLDGQPLALRAANLLRGVVADVALLGGVSRYEHIGVPVIPDKPARPDRERQRGPLAGLCAGLASSRTDWNLFLACDMPLMSAALLRTLLDCATDTSAQAVVPYVGGRWEPLCAVYHRDCLHAMETTLAGGERSVVKSFARIRVEAIPGAQFGDEDFCARVFRNVNTARDWQEIQTRKGLGDGYAA